MKDNMNETNAGHNEIVRAGVAAAQLRVVHGLDAVLDSMTPPEIPAASVTLARRQVANMSKFWKFCDRSQCHRARRCRGEPLDCMRIAATAMPPQVFEPWLQRGKGGARRSREKSAASAGP